MNRIVLIGNGFDLAHGLPTSYRHFIANYWKKRIRTLKLNETLKDEDDFYRFIIEYNLHLHRHPKIKDFLNYDGANIVESCIGLTDQISKANKHYSVKMDYQCKNSLFQIINDAYHIQWVDIENEYYRLMNYPGAEPRGILLIKKLFGRKKQKFFN